MVIAIIAVLIAILLPVLQKARLRAQQVVCASNIRQIALACLTYAHDNKEILPIPCDQWERHADSSPIPPEAAIFMVDTGLYDYEKGVLWPDLGGPDSRRRVFNCPTDPDPRPLPAAWEQPGDNRNFSYAFNLALAMPRGWSPPYSNAGGDPGVPLTLVRQSSHKVLVGEPESPGTSTTDFFYVGNNGTDFFWFLTTRHFGWPTKRS